MHFVRMRSPAFTYQDAADADMVLVSLFVTAVDVVPDSNVAGTNVAPQARGGHCGASAYFTK